MKTKKVSRHYCEHCGKGMFNGPRMLSHESMCFNNPRRECPLCESFPLNLEPLFHEFISEFKVRPVSEDDCEAGLLNSVHISWLQSKLNGCPACIVSFIQQGCYRAFDYNYKKERDAFMHIKEGRRLMYNQ